jgi:hypothetical protein
MEQSILIGLAIALIFFVWVWIGLTIMSRLSLEQKIEKLEAIENRLPEEERNLTHLKELRAIEQSKVSSAKMVLGLFGLLLIGAMGATAASTKLQDIFGFENLKVFYYLGCVILAFMVLPTFFGLSLAGSTKDKGIDKKEKVSAKEGAA